MNEKKFLEKAKALKRYVSKIRTEYINGRDMDAFINIIKNRIGGKIVIVDIRWSTFYKSKQSFSPAKFKNILAANDIGYVRNHTLGNPLKKESLTLDGPAVAKQKYIKYLRNDEKAIEAFNALHKLLRFNKIYCLICYCQTEDPLQCHRFWLKEELINRKRIELGFTGDYLLQKIKKREVIER